MINCVRNLPSVEYSPKVYEYEERYSQEYEANNSTVEVDRSQDPGFMEIPAKGLLKEKVQKLHVAVVLFGEYAVESHSLFEKSIGGRRTPMNVKTQCHFPYDTTKN